MQNVNYLYRSGGPPGFGSPASYAQQIAGDIGSNLRSTQSPGYHGSTQISGTSTAHGVTFNWAVTAGPGMINLLGPYLITVGPETLVSIVTEGLTGMASYNAQSLAWSVNDASGAIVMTVVIRLVDRGYGSGAISLSGTAPMPLVSPISEQPSDGIVKRAIFCAYPC